MKYCNVQQIYVKSLRPLIVSRRKKQRLRYWLRSSVCSLYEEDNYMKTLLRIILGCANVYLAANLFYYLIVKPIVNLYSAISNGCFSIDILLLTICKIAVMFAFIGLEAYIFEKIEGKEFHDSNM